MPPQFTQAMYVEMRVVQLFPVPKELPLESMPLMMPLTLLDSPDLFPPPQPLLKIPLLLQKERNVAPRPRLRLTPKLRLMPKPPPGIMVDTMDIPDTMDIMVMDMAKDMVMAMVWDMDTDLDTDMLI